MELEKLKQQINHLFEHDDNFLKLDNDYIIDHDLEILSKFIEERYKIIHSINSILEEGVTLDKEYIEAFKAKVIENTSLLTEKTLLMQSKVKDRILKTNNFKSAHLYFHNTHVNPVFIDKTV